VTRPRLLLATRSTHKLRELRELLHLPEDVLVSLDDLGVGWDDPFVVEDLVNDERYEWRGARNYVELDPATRPAHVFRVSRAG